MFHVQLTKTIYDNIYHSLFSLLRKRHTCT